MVPFFSKKLKNASERRNWVQAAVLVAVVGAVVGVACFIIWGAAGAASALLLIAILVALAPRIPAALFLRLYRATLIRRDESQLSSLVDVLAYRAELTQRPTLYVVPSTTMNAFTVGRPHRGAIAVTEGLLRRLTLREIAGILAHEMSHIRNHDLWVFAISDVLTRFLQLVSYAAMGLALLNVIGTVTDGETVPWTGILLLYVAPAIASFLQLSLPRGREYECDVEAAALTGDPMGLAAAMRRLETYTGHFWEDLMFPVPARRVPQPSLLRTHPPSEERIRRLLALDGVPRLEPIVIVEQPMVSLVGYGPGDMRPRYRWPGLWF